MNSPGTVLGTPWPPKKSSPFFSPKSIAPQIQEEALPLEVLLCKISQAQRVRKANHLSSNCTQSSLRELNIANQAHHVQQDDAIASAHHSKSEGITQDRAGWMGCWDATRPQTRRKCLTGSLGQGKCLRLEPAPLGHRGVDQGL